MDRGLWTAEVRNQIIADKGSIQAVDAIPTELKELYKTVWEIKQRVIIDQACERGAFICQSQSLNIHIAEPTVARLTSMHFYGWKQGLKTGMYYLRTRPKAEAIQFTVDQTALAKTKKAASATATATGATATGATAVTGAPVVPASAAAVSKPVVAPASAAGAVQGAVQGLEYAAEAACESCSA